MTNGGRGVVMMVANGDQHIAVAMQSCGGGLVQHRKGPDAGGASGPWDSAYSGATIKTIRRCWGFRRLEYCP